MKETAESGELSVSEIHTLVAVGRRAPKTMSTIAQDLLINVSTLSIAINKLEKIGKASEAPKAPTEKECPYCKSMIPIKAVRCPHCTSELEK